MLIQEEYCHMNLLFFKLIFSKDAIKRKLFLFKFNGLCNDTHFCNEYNI